MHRVSNYLTRVETSHYRTTKWYRHDYKTPLALHRRVADKALMALDFAAAYIRPSGTYLEGLRRAVSATVYSKEEFLRRNKTDTDDIMLDAASRALKKDREVALAAVSRSGENLAFASKALRNDREVILTAIRNDPFAFQFASETLRSNREIALEAVGRGGNNLAFVGNALGNDREVVLTAIREQASAFKFASEALRNDKEVVLAVIREGGSAHLQFASEALRRDLEDVILTAKRKGGAPAFQFASEALRRDLEVVIATIKKDISALRHAPLDLQTSRDILTAYDPRLLELDIEFLSRFSRYEDVQEIIENRQNIGRRDERKLAVLFYPKTDHNGALNNNTINILIRTGFRVLYFEVALAQQLVTLLRAATAEQKADLLVVAGHGTRGSIQLGINSHVTSRDRALFQQTTECLTGNSSVILQACSTANGNGNGQHLADFFGDIFPHSIIIAAKTASEEILRYPHLDSTGRVIGVGSSDLPGISQVVVFPPSKST